MSAASIETALNAHSLAAFASLKCSIAVDAELADARETRDDNADDDDADDDDDSNDDSNDASKDPDADVDDKSSKRRSARRTPGVGLSLLHAALHGSADAVRLLVHAGCLVLLIFLCLSLSLSLSLYLSILSHSAKRVAARRARAPPTRYSRRAI